MEIIKDTIDLQDSTDICTVYHVTDGYIEIRITLVNGKHYETDCSSKLKQ